MPANLTPIVDDHLHGPLAEVVFLLRSYERRAHVAEARLVELEQGTTPAPLYWQAERDQYEATIRQMGAGARAWQSAYAALHKQLRDNGIEPIRWMESINV